MSRRVLITGGSGFVGQWLSRALLQQGWTVFAGTIDGPPSGAVLSEKEKQAVCWTPLDVRSEESVRKAVEMSRPDRAVHLAGIAYPPEANADPARTHDINALGAVRLLKALAAVGAAVRALIVGSAEQYGAHPVEDYPLKETATLNPMTPYAQSKMSQETLSLQCSRETGVPVVCTRSFNHSGVGHAETYLLPSLVHRARDLPATGGTLRMGNGAPVRDFLHIADVIEAYERLLERGEAGEVYNVSSAKGTSVREIARRVLKRLGVSAEIVEDPAFVRPSDMPILVGDNTKLRRTTGWAPQRTIDDIIDDLIHAASR
jgi:GDP-4-dehydro-6-deoxy-D-mannose reductase